MALHFWGLFASKNGCTNNVRIHNFATILVLSLPSIYYYIKNPFHFHFHKKKKKKRKKTKRNVSPSLCHLTKWEFVVLFLFFCDDKERTFEVKLIVWEWARSDRIWMVEKSLWTIQRKWMETIETILRVPYFNFIQWHYDRRSHLIIVSFCVSYSSFLLLFRSIFCAVFEP